MDESESAWLLFMSREYTWPESLYLINWKKLNLLDPADAEKLRQTLRLLFRVPVWLEGASLRLPALQFPTVM